MTPAEWNRAALAHAPASGAFLQAHEWGAFQEKLGRTVRRYGAGGRVAQAVSRPMPGGLFGWDVFRAATDDTLLTQILADLKKTSGVFVHGEPATPGNVRGVRATNRQPQHTAVLDLAPSEDALLAAMHQKTRYNIRLAQRHGVTVRVGTPDDWPAAWRIFAATAARDRFALHPAAHYQRMLETLDGPLAASARATAHLVLAEHEGDLLAALILIRFGDTVTYLHGASGNVKRELMAPHLLHGETMRMAKAAGCTRYDFWGVAPEDASPDHPWSGITRFKMGFGPTRVAMPEAWELPLRPMWYRLYRLLKRTRS